MATTSLFGDSLSGLGRAVGHSARLASSLFDDLSLNGQFNLLTTTSFDRPQDLFSMNVDVPRSIAYVALEAPGASGDWTMRGSITRVTCRRGFSPGRTRGTAEAAHAYEAGLSYACSSIWAATVKRWPRCAIRSRNVGALYAFDTWTIAPHVRVGYGAKYARYDYLADRGPVEPARQRRLQAVAARQPDVPRDAHRIARSRPAPRSSCRRQSARGCRRNGRSRTSPTRAFRPERHDHFELAVERTWAGPLLVGVRAFRQRVDDQVVTLFGVAVADVPAGVGHYQVGSAGDFDATGWGVSVSRVVGDSVRAAVDYTQANTEMAALVSRSRRAQRRWRRRSCVATNAFTT